MKDPKLGTRVRVHITDPWGHVLEAIANMNGKTGHVVTRYVDTVLVRFDTPAVPWHSHQGPVEQFWFHPKELERE